MGCGNARLEICEPDEYVNLRAGKLGLPRSWGNSQANW